MKKAILVGSLVAALFAGILLVNAAEQQPQPQQKAKEEGGPAMPMNPQMMMQRMMGMMQQAGADTEIVRRCRTMMFTPVFPDSPAGIRGQSQVLGLSDEQIKKLLDIENEARQKAKSVLNEEQMKKMGETPDKSMTMMEMCQQMKSVMMPMMQNMMGTGSPGSPQMMCPMMQMMMGGPGTPQGSGTTSDK